MKNKGKGSHAKPLASKSSLPTVISARLHCPPLGLSLLLPAPQLREWQSRIAPPFIFLFCDANQVG